MLNVLTKYLLKPLHHGYRALSRRNKRSILIAMDVFLFFLAIYSSFWLRFGEDDSEVHISKYAGLVLLLITIKLLVFYFKGIYRPVIRYTGLEFLSTAGAAVFYSSGMLVILAYLQGFWPLPRSVLIIDALLTFILVIGVRLLIRSLAHQLTFRCRPTSKLPERLVIYGAGVAGSQLARALQNDHGYSIVSFVDDNADLQHQVIQGFRVYSPEYLHQLYRQQPFNTVILAIPSLDKVRKRQIIEQLQSLPVLVKTVPSLTEILSDKLSISAIRNIDVVELLGREEVKPDPELLRLNITGKSVLVTGAGGSIGSELCRQIAQLAPKFLVLYELSEHALYQIDLELGEIYPYVQRFAYLGNVTHQSYLETILRRHEVDTIYHAAAYKHVPLVEHNPGPGVYNNVGGTLMAAQSAINCQVSHFVLISTDKAVRPTNVMGASKRVAELLVQGLADQPHINTCFAMVRFGNVLDSSGSVVPRFRKQIAEGKPLTVTHRKVTRYFMSIPEAVRLVLQAGAMAQGGEIFLLDMGEPIPIYHLAEQMIRLSGLVPVEDIPIEIVGLRPGEKLYEELLIDSATSRPTKHPKIFAAREAKMRWLDLKPQLETLLNKAELNDYDGIIAQLKALVPEYCAAFNRT